MITSFLGADPLANFSPAVQDCYNRYKAGEFGVIGSDSGKVAYQACLRESALKSSYTDGLAVNQTLSNTAPSRLTFTLLRDDAAGDEFLDPNTGLPPVEEPWYMNKTYWLIGGAALLGAALLLKR